MILTDSDIQQAIGKSEILIEPFSEKQIQPASYDLRVGAAGISTTSGGKVDVEGKGFFELRPGDVGILLTRESLEFDASHTARIGLRSKYARKGVIATVGPQVDPGFRGRLKIGVTNLTPHTVAFPFEDDFVTLEIHKLSRPSSSPYDGPYQGVEDLSPDDIEAVTEKENMSFARVLETLSTLSRNVSELAESVKNFEKISESNRREIRTVLWVVGVGMAALAAMMGFVGILAALK